MFQTKRSAIICTLFILLLFISMLSLSIVESIWGGEGGDASSFVTHIPVSFLRYSIGFVGIALAVANTTTIKNLRNSEEEEEEEEEKNEYS